MTPSVTPNLQDALAVQQLMREVTQGQLSALPLLRAIRGTGAGAVDLGNSSLTVASPNDFGSVAVKHALGLLPTVVLVSASGPVVFGSFHGVSLMTYSWAIDQFTVEAQTPGYTGGVVINFSWLAIAIQF